MNSTMKTRHRSKLHGVALLTLAGLATLTGTARAQHCGNTNMVSDPRSGLLNLYQAPCTWPPGPFKGHTLTTYTGTDGFEYRKMLTTTAGTIRVDRRPCCSGAWTYHCTYTGQNINCIVNAPYTPLNPVSFVDMEFLGPIGFPPPNLGVSNDIDLGAVMIFDLSSLALIHEVGATGAGQGVVVPGELISPGGMYMVVGLTPSGQAHAFGAFHHSGGQVPAALPSLNFWHNADTAEFSAVYSVEVAPGEMRSFYQDSSGAFALSAGHSGGEICGDEERTQSASSALTTSVWCGSTQVSAHTVLARAFTADITASLTCVDFGVLNNVGGETPVRIGVYEGPVGAFGPGSTPIAEAEVLVPAGAAGTMHRAMLGDVPLTAGTDFIVTLGTVDRRAAAGGDEGRIELGCNSDGQAAPTYIYAPQCGATSLITLDAVGFGNRHLVMTLLLSTGDAPPCPADYNQDGGIDGADVAAFFADWEEGLPGADVNQDGGIDGADAAYFFEVWENGGC
jgi:hypothetical protein